MQEGRNNHRLIRNNKFLLQKKKKERTHILTERKEIESTKHELLKSKNTINHLQAQLANAYRSIDQLILRVAELENSKFYKLRKLLSFYFKRLFKNFKTNEKKGFIYFLFNKNTYRVRCFINYFTNSIITIFNILSYPIFKSITII